jgi:hypothetical protein
LATIEQISRPIRNTAFTMVQDMPPKGGYEPVQYKVRGWQGVNVVQRQILPSLPSGSVGRISCSIALRSSGRQQQRD